MDRPLIIYLDQNKWIELARARKNPADYPAQYQLLKNIIDKIKCGRAIFPITSTNIYETHKINDPIRRSDIAKLQSILSQGRVFRGRHRRLEVELGKLLSILYGIPAIDHSQQWFLSDIFLEAWADLGDKRLQFTISDRIINFLRAAPERSLYEYLVNTQEDVRIAAVKNFTDGSEALRLRVEERRRQHADESREMKRRIYNALMMINEYEMIIEFANRLGFSWKTVSDIGEETMLRIIDDVPLYFIEREISVRLEAQSRPIEQNDFRDMQSFCAIIPYADIVIGEKQFTNIARQAGLDKKYGTHISANIQKISEIFDSSQ